MSIYKYSDFEKQLKASGLEKQFSTADLALAQQNPDAGMAILSAKRNYLQAKTPEARALANAEADSVRKSYGGYTGGADGGSFNLEPLSPNSFQGSEAPVYSNPYKDRVEAALSKVEKRQPFTYDPSTDPVYQAYDKKYTREGQLATEDVLGKASVMTGGVPSTAAITAAGQTANQYAAAKADIIPTLYQQAYDRAMAEFTADRQVLSDLMGADAQEFGKYQTELGQHNTENAFKYGQLLDEIGAQADVRGEEFTKQQYDDTLKQLELENERYDREYSDSRADTEWSQQMAEKEYSDSLEQQKKQNEYTERELSRLEANAAIDNAYTTEQLTQLKEGKTSGATGGEDTDEYKQLKATYDAVYDSKIRELKGKKKGDDRLVSDELLENILPFETWYELKKANYGNASGYDSYEEYLEETAALILEAAEKGEQ